MPSQPQSRMPRKRPSPAPDSGDDTPAKRRKKPVACRPCHSRKVKCSGGLPCSNCEQAKCPDDCSYPVRDQKVTVSNSYIEQLVSENERLRTQSLSRQASEPRGAPRDGGDTQDSPAEKSDSALNPLLAEKGWFHPLATSGNIQPVHIGEAADTAFATRCRQALSDDDNLKHIPRMHYISDDRLAVLASRECPWPPMPRARLLIRFAMDTVGSCYHCIRKSAVYSGLKQHYRNLPATNSSTYAYKLWALFAIGEVYSCRTPSPSDDNFPGIVYFAQANRIKREFSERPSVDMIEVLLLLSLYSLLLNRRYDAYSMAGNAVRDAVIMGLNHDMAEYHFPDRAAREHRIRVWWTAYILDRLWASKMGHAVSIQDDDITVQLPSDDGLTAADADDFQNADHMVACIKLARISRDIIVSLYNRKATHPFSQRVQKALGDLRVWVGALPNHLQIDSRDHGRPLQRHVKWLHLSFNQYVILATRPILLHVFRTHKDLWTAPANNRNLKEEIGETAMALAEACIRCARHSHHLLTDSWIDGSFAIFDFVLVQYLFSSTTILAISSLSLGRADQEDKDTFEYASQFVEQLRRNGNLGAREFHGHLEALRLTMTKFLAESGQQGENQLEVTDTAGLPIEAMAPPDLALSNSNTPGYFPTMTTEMALAEPSLQQFLSQAEIDLGFLDMQMQDSAFQSLYVPGGVQSRSWNPDGQV